MGTHRAVIILGALTGFLTVLCLALAGVLIWREFFADSTTSKERDPKYIYVNTTNLTEVRLKFPGYFQTPRELQMLIQANEAATRPQPVVNVSRVYSRCFTNGYCELLPQGGKTFTTTTLATTTNTSNIIRSNETFALNRRRRQVSPSEACSLDVFDEDDLTFHGCCISHSNFEAPTSLTTAEPGQTGETVIAQFPGLKQYFEIQYCCQAQNCTGCQCAQTYYVTSAVVPKVFNQGTFFGTEYVRVPGCCKCLNISPEGDQREGRGQ